MIALKVGIVATVPGVVGKSGEVILIGGYPEGEKCLAATT